MEIATIYRAKGDGNFFNALSMLLFVDEAHSVEMRARLILFMVLNSHNFSPNLEQQIAKTFTGAVKLVVKISVLL